MGIIKQKLKKYITSFVQMLDKKENFLLYISHIINFIIISTPVSKILYIKRY